MSAIGINRKCERCSGIGVITAYGETPTVCPDCSGTGKMPFADSAELDTRLSDLLDRCNDILDKCNDIFEAVTEQ